MAICHAYAVGSQRANRWQIQKPYAHSTRIFQLIKYGDCYQAVYFHMPDHHCHLLHPHCNAVHDGLDSDDIGFPPIRKTTPDNSSTNRPNLLNYESSRHRYHQHQSLSKQDASSSPSPQLPRSRPPKKGLGSKNILNTIQITVHQPKVFQVPGTHYAHFTQWFAGCSLLFKKAKLWISRYCQSESPPFKKAAFHLVLESPVICLFWL